MNRFRARLAMAGMITLLYAVWVMTEAGRSRPWNAGQALASEQKKGPESARPTPKTGDGKQDLQSRWKRLRGEYIEIAEALMEHLDPPERPGVPRLIDQQLQTQKAEAVYQNAKLDRQIAELALKDYTEGTAKWELEGAKVAITVAEAELKRAEKSVERVKSVRAEVTAKLDAKGEESTAGDLLARFHLDVALENEALSLELRKIDLERAKLNQDVLTKYSHKKRRSELQAEIEKSRSDEIMRQQEWELAKLKEAKLKAEATVAGVRPEWREALAVLIEAIRSPGPKLPWEREPDEFHAFLDRFATKLAEARSLMERANEKAEMERLMRLDRRMVRVQTAPAGK